MNVVYSDKVRQTGEGIRQLERATKYLEEELGSSAAEAKAEWDLDKDSNGQPRFTLRLSHRGDTASTSFTSEDLQDAADARFRVNQIWGALLEERQEQQLRELRELASQET